MLRRLARCLAKPLTAILLLAAPAVATAADATLADRSTLNQIIRRGELRVGFEAGYMPFEMLDRNNNLMGFDVDLARKMASVLKVRLRFVNTAWDGIIPALLTDKFDLLMGGMTITPERNLQVNFARPYIVVGQTVLLAKKHEGVIASHLALNDAKFIVSSKLGTSGDLAARRTFPRAQLKQFESESDAALEVRNGRADAFVYDSPFNLIYAAQHPQSVAHLAEPFTREALGWAVRKGDPDFINWLDNFLESIRNDGTYDLLYQRWFVDTAWMKNLPQ